MHNNFNMRFKLQETDSHPFKDCSNFPIKGGNLDAVRDEMGCYFNFGLLF